MMGHRIVGMGGAAGFGGRNDVRFEMEEESNHSDEFSDSDHDEDVDTDSNSGTDLNKISRLTENKINALMNLATSIKGARSHNAAASSSSTTTMKQSNYSPRIQMSPPQLFILQQNQPNKWWSWHLKPQFLFLGPINHLQYSVEPIRLKERLAALYIKDVSRVGEIYSHVLASMEEIKRCYDERVISLPFYTNENLAWILLVDGCALLFLIDCFVFQDLHAFRANSIHMHKVCSDVFSMENQLPYMLLKLLVKHRIGSVTREAVIHAFVDTFNMPGDVVRRSGKDDHYELYGCPNHLLDLLWMKVGLIDQKGSGSLLASTKKRIKGMVKRPPGTNYYSISKLKAAGIHLKPSKSKLLTDVSFSHGIFLSGKLALPRLVLDGYSKLIWSSLIAYEMCPDFQRRQHVTSYVCFINSLISTVEDVAELRSAGIIIVNSSDAEVLGYFRSWANDVIPDPTIYSGVRRNIETYLDRKIRTTMATWIASLASPADKYSKRSWTTLALYLTLAIIMMLSTIQTYFAIFPRKLGSS